MNPIILTGSTPDGRSAIVYACGSCLMTAPGGITAAEQCCSCSHCHGPKDRATRGSYTTCATCDPIVTAEREEARRSKAFALPHVEDHAGPFYVDDLDRYVEDRGALDDLLADEDEPADGWLIYPCTVGKAPTPDLADVVHEAWCDEFDDSDMAGDLPETVYRYLAEAQRVAIEHAPVVWRADMTRRVYMPRGTTA